MSGTAERVNPRYTFDTFVVGSSNQFAQAACQAVAELPSRAYNPLFIYGGVGLGKTHLLHAVGHQSVRLFPGMAVVYISSERFTNELINAIRYDRTAEFRARYRTIDLLLIDDIQFISGKERTQEEKIITIEQIQRKVCDLFGIRLSDLKAKTRTKAIAFPRQIAMYLARQLTHASLAEVGRAFGGKDHTTVLHAVDKVQALLQEDPKLRKTIDGLIQGITL